MWWVIVQLPASKLQGASSGELHVSFMGTRLSWVESFKSADGTYRACTRCMQLHVWPTAAALAALIDEIDYTWRLDPHNHALPPFDRAVTGIVDTLPIYIPSPHNWYLSTLFFQPKYKACVLKMQLGILTHGRHHPLDGPSSRRRA